MGGDRDIWVVKADGSQPNYAPADHANFDVHPDGTRFIVVTGRERPQRLIVAFDPRALVAPAK